MYMCNVLPRNIGKLPGSVEVSDKTPINVIEARISLSL